MTKDLQKKAQRRLAREQARQVQLAQRRRAQRRRALTYAGIALAAVAALSWAVWASLRPKPGVAYPDQGRAHVQVGQPHPPYNSNPPTSGPHYPSPAPWGFYTEELPDETLVHNLEHGGIWISYRDPNDTELIDRLAALSRRFPRKVIITLRTRNDSRLAVAAWTRLLKLEQYDEEQIISFINAFRGKGPERAAD